jgi:hypothetical protein
VVDRLFEGEEAVFHLIEGVVAPLGLRVVFIANDVMVSAKPGLDLNLQIVQVLERPSHLQLMVERSAAAHGAQNGDTMPGENANRAGLREELDRG